MREFMEKDYKVFEMFDKQWALVTAGTMEHFNSCTVSWGEPWKHLGPRGKNLPHRDGIYTPGPLHQRVSERQPDLHCQFLPGSLSEGVGLYGFPLRS